MKNFNNDSKYNSNFKISKEFKENRHKENYDHIFEYENRAREFEKMLESINNNMKFYNEHKIERIKKDKKLMRILNSDTQRFVLDDLIEDDDIRLSKEELDFLNQIEYDINEATFYEKNLELIESINNSFKKKLVLDSLNNLEESDKFIIFKRVESDLLNALSNIENHLKISSYDLMNESSIRKINYKNCMNILNMIYKNYFELFYAMTFNKIYKYFSSDIFLEVNKNKINLLSNHSDYNEENELILFDEKTLARLETYDDLERSAFFLTFIKKESYKTLRALLDNYLNLPYDKKVIRNIIDGYNDNQDFLSKKIELFRLISLFKLDYNDGMKLLSISDRDKILSFPTEETREHEYKKLLSKNVKLLISEIENMKKKPLDNDSKNLFFSIIDLNKILVSFYEVNHILNNISLEIEKDSVNYFISNDNKMLNMLCDIIVGNINMLYGDIYINGENISIHNLDDRKNIASKNITDILINNTFDNISLYDFVTLSTNRSKFDHNDLNILFQELKISDLIEYDINSLDEYEKTRSQIAQSIYSNKSIILIRTSEYFLNDMNYLEFEKIVNFISKKYNVCIIILRNSDNNISNNQSKYYFSNGKLIQKYIKRENEWY